MAVKVRAVKENLWKQLAPAQAAGTAVQDEDEWIAKAQDWRLHAGNLYAGDPTDDELKAEKEGRLPTLLKYKAKALELWARLETAHPKLFEATPTLQRQIEWSELDDAVMPLFGAHR